MEQVNTKPQKTENKFNDLPTALHPKRRVSLPVFVISVIGVLLLVYLGFTAYYNFNKDCCGMDPQNIPVVTTTPVQTVYETSSLQTYTNEEFGFAFDYPQDWSVYASNNSTLIGPKGDIDNLKSLVESGIGIDSGCIAISIIILPSMPTYGDSWDIEKNTLVVGGETATEYIMTALVSGPGYDKGAMQYQVVVPMENKYYIISRCGDQYSSEFSNVISSFKFLN